MSVTQDNHRWILVSPKPPPRHGAARAVEILLDGKRKIFEWDHIDARFVKSVDQLQKVSFGKLVTLLRYLFRLICKLPGSRGVVLTPSFVPSAFLKDSIFIWTATLFSRGPVVAWYHMQASTMNYDKRHPLFRWYAKLTLERLDWHVCVAARLIESMPNFLNREKIVVIPNGIPALTKSPLAKKKIKGSLGILYVSNFGDAKGWRILFKVSEVLCARFSNIHFSFYGAPLADTSENELRETFAKSIFPERICYCGFLNEENKSRVFEEADILAFPSLNEAFPITLLEALSAGLAIVASNVGGVEESVINNSGGYLVVPGEEGSLTEALARLILSEEDRAKFGAFNRELFLEKFNEVSFQERWLDFLMEISA